MNSFEKPIAIALNAATETIQHLLADNGKLRQVLQEAGKRIEECAEQGERAKVCHSSDETHELLNKIKAILGTGK